MAMRTKVIGPISAYAIAVANGYTGTEAEFAEQIANAATNAQTAQAAADHCDDVLESIPQDYSALSGEVDDLKSATSDIENVVYIRGNQYDWENMGNTTYPEGWMQGYYKQSDGDRLTTSSAKANYISSRIGVYGEGNILEITPPTGYGVRVAVYSGNAIADYIESVGSMNVNEVVSVNVTDGYYYRFSIGPFSGDAASHYADGEFLATIVLKFITTLKTKVNELEEEIGSIETDAEIIKNASVSTFLKIGVCGASWDSGYYYVGSNHYENNALSWLANLARKNGANYDVYAKHSLYTKTWLSDSDGLTKLLNATPCNLYITSFGGNDSEQGSSYLGSIADISGSYTDYPDTFYGNYGKIIEQIQIHAPKALIVMVMYYNSATHSATRKEYYDAVVEIANHYNIPVINWANDKWYKGSFVMDNLVHNHPTPIQLSGIADAFARLFSDCVANNYSYFATYNP